MRKPNFFIVGAAKCGTTSMYHYLRTHPNIFMSRLKEPQYFADDHPERVVATEKDYLRLFKGATEVHQVAGEATPLYMRSRTALVNIKASCERAKILVTVRNPVDMLISYHAMGLLALIENEPDFEQAWRLQSARREGRMLPPLCPDFPGYLQYRDVASLGTQLQRVFELFPPEQVHVVLFDDLVSDCRRVYEDLLAFLDLPSDGRSQFPVLNERKQLRWPGLQRVIDARNLPLWLQRFGLRFGLERLYRPLRRMNMKVAEKRHVRPEFRQELNEVFRDEVLLLSQMTGRDLSHWGDPILPAARRLDRPEEVASNV